MVKSLKLEKLVNIPLMQLRMFTWLIVLNLIFLISFNHMTTEAWLPQILFYVMSRVLD